MGTCGIQRVDFFAGDFIDEADFFAGAFFDGMTLPTSLMRTSLFGCFTTSLGRDGSSDIVCFIHAGESLEEECSERPDQAEELTARSA